MTSYRLDLEPFLTAVNGHVPMLGSTHRLAEETEDGDRRRDGPWSADDAEAPWIARRQSRGTRSWAQSLLNVEDAT